MADEPFFVMTTRRDNAEAFARSRGVEDHTSLILVSMAQHLMGVEGYGKILYLLTDHKMVASWWQLLDIARWRGFTLEYVRSH